MFILDGGEVSLIKGAKSDIQLAQATTKKQDENNSESIVGDSEQDSYNSEGGKPTHVIRYPGLFRLPWPLSSLVSKFESSNVDINPGEKVKSRLKRNIAICTVGALAGASILGYMELAGMLTSAALSTITLGPALGIALGSFLLASGVAMAAHSAMRLHKIIDDEKKGYPIYSRNETEKRKEKINPGHNTFSAEVVTA